MLRRGYTTFSRIIRQSFRQSSIIMAEYHFRGEKITEQERESQLKGKLENEYEYEYEYDNYDGYSIFNRVKYKMILYLHHLKHITIFSSAINLNRIDIKYPTNTPNLQSINANFSSTFFWRRGHTYLRYHTVPWRHVGTVGFRLTDTSTQRLPITTNTVKRFLPQEFSIELKKSHPILRNSFNHSYNKLRTFYPPKRKEKGSQTTEKCRSVCLSLTQS